MKEDRIPETLEDLQHEKAKELAQAHNIKRMMTDLKEYKNFISFKDHLQDQYEQLVRLVLCMPNGQDDLIKNAYNAGQAAGIKIALDTPELIINGANASIERARLEEELGYNGEESRQAGTESSWYGDDGDFTIPGNPEG